MFGLLAPSDALAKKEDRGFKPQLHAPPKGTMVDVESDSLVYDSKTGIATATGRVVITYGDYILVARKVIYDRRNDRFRADGEVRLTEPGGNILEANVAQLENHFRDGFAEYLRLLLTNDAILTAEFAVRRDGTVTTFTRVTYTRCRTCVTATGTPLWEIRSAEVVYDETEHTITHKNATLDLMGVPVFWLPTLSHPDPTVTRRTGFLVPEFGYTDEMGVAVQVPYFWNLAPNYDLTFLPTFTSRQGPLARGIWRHRLTQGEYSIDAAGIYQLDTDVKPPGDRHFRGFVRTRGEFALNEPGWTWGWDATATSDETFMRDYDIDRRTEIANVIYVTGIQDRNYFTARAYQFQGLLESDNNATFPIMAPYIRSNWVMDRSILGGEFGVDTAIYSLYREDPNIPYPGVYQGTEQTRAVVDARWQNEIVTNWGQQFTPFAKVRGDLTLNENLPDPRPYDYDYLRGDEAVARLLPTVGLDLRWPFIGSGGGAQHIITPVTQIIASSNESDTDEIGNEDAITLNLDGSSLFLHDRFTGYDRFEGGTRINAGLLYTMLLPDGGFARMSFGESFHIAGENSFTYGSGLETPDSDFVAAVALQPWESIRFTYQARFDEATFDVKAQETSLSTDFWRISSNISYVNVQAAPFYGRPYDQEQVWGSGSLDLAYGWNLFGGFRYDLAADKVIRNVVGVGYNCDCANVRVYYKEEYTDDRETNLDQSVMMSVQLKTLGTGSIGQKLD